MGSANSIGSTEMCMRKLETWLDSSRLSNHASFPFLLEGLGGERQSRGLLTNRVTQNPATLLKELGWIGRASGAGVSAEKGCTWENRLSSSEISPQSPLGQLSWLLGLWQVCQTTGP